MGLPSDACGIARGFDGERGYVHFAGPAALCFADGNPHWLTDRARDPAQAAMVLAQAQGMLTWRMLAAERRLTGCALTPTGSSEPVGLLTRDLGAGGCCGLSG